MFSRSPFLCGDSLSLMECMDNDCYPAVRFRRPDDGGTQGFPRPEIPVFLKVSFF